MAKQTISPWQSFAWNKVPPGPLTCLFATVPYVPQQMSPFSRACAIHLHSSPSRYVAGFSHFSGPHSNMMIMSSKGHMKWVPLSNIPLTSKTDGYVVHGLQILVEQIDEWDAFAIASASRSYGFSICVAFFFLLPTLNVETPSSTNFDFRLLSSCGFFCAIVCSAHASLVLVPSLSFKIPNSTAW